MLDGEIQTTVNADKINRYSENILLCAHMTYKLKSSHWHWEKNKTFVLSDLFNDVKISWLIVHTHCKT